MEEVDRRFVQRETIKLLYDATHNGESASWEVLLGRLRDAQQQPADDADDLGLAP